MEYYNERQVEKIVEEAVTVLFNKFAKSWRVEQVHSNGEVLKIALRHRTKLNLHEAKISFKELFERPTEVYTGKLSLGEHYDDELDGILLVNGEPLARTVQEGRDEYGKYLSVSYYITDQSVTDEDELQEAFLGRLDGLGEVDFDIRYSEITGYLWTDEELKVGGHDLIEELTSYVGKYLYLKVTYSKIPF